MTADEIINAWCDNALVERGANKVFPNVYAGSFEADIMELSKSGYATEYEVKVTRADFRNDAKKQRTYAARPPESKYGILQEGGRVNRFCYIVPDGLIAKSDIPDFAGLVYAERISAGYYSHEKGFYSKEKISFITVKAAPLLTKEKISEKMIQKCLESTYYRFHEYRRRNAYREYLSNNKENEHK
jgi:hypothetical protein